MMVKQQRPGLKCLGFFYMYFRLPLAVKVAQLRSLDCQGRFGICQKPESVGLSI
jgi:hypothetical protein